MVSILQIISPWKLAQKFAHGSLNSKKCVQSLKNSFIAIFPISNDPNDLSKTQ